jgi:molecular chaperone GrpE
MTKQDKKEHKEKKVKLTEEEKIAKAMEELIAENADIKDKLLRTMSDMENLRKRTQKEISDMATYSVSKFAKEMLAVSDNLKRAMSSISVKDREEDESLNNLFKGVEVTENQLVKSFEGFNIKKISCEGIFDPNVHEVMMEQEGEGDAGTIVMVLEEGFTIGERLLRPARVIVSK